jgi:hypothetical protein
MTDLDRFLEVWLRAPLVGQRRDAEQNQSDTNVYDRFPIHENSVNRTPLWPIGFNIGIPHHECALTRKGMLFTNEQNGSWNAPEVYFHNCSILDSNSFPVSAISTLDLRFANWMLDV